MKSVSVKQLRLELPHVLKEVEQGEEFLIIYHSKPIGEIIPLRRRQRRGRQKDIFKLLKEPWPELNFPKGKTAADLIREDRDASDY
jgi:antitoxin (DNA-binding transcriptional repressor) of toxin-antitoxin stability system